MIKQLAIREEDYWIHAVTVCTIILLMFAFWAATLPFILPLLILGGLGLWFSTAKIRDGYGKNRARIHVVLTVVVASVLAFLLYSLTN